MWQRIGRSSSIGTWLPGSRYPTTPITGDCGMRKHLIAVGLFCASMTCALAQTPVEPAGAAERNPNPANSISTDEDGNNPLATVGEHSPTGWNKNDAMVSRGGGDDAKAAGALLRDEATERGPTLFDER